MLSFESRVKLKMVTVSRPILDVLKEQVDAGFRRRDEKFIEEVFKKYSTINRATSISHIEKKDLIMALKEFDAFPDVTQEDLCKEDNLFRRLDRNQDGILAFDEFVLAVKASMPLDEWASSLPLAQILADAMPRKAGKDRLREVALLTEAEIESIANGFAYGVKRLLNQHVQGLRSSFSNMDQAATRSESGSHLKFQTETSKLRCGNIEDFHNGMSSRIGALLRFDRAAAAISFFAFAPLTRWLQGTRT